MLTKCLSSLIVTASKKPKGVFKGKRGKAKHARYVDGRDRKKRTVRAEAATAATVQPAHRPRARNTNQSVPELKAQLESSRRSNRRLSRGLSKVVQEKEKLQVANTKLRQKNKTLCTTVRSSRATLRETCSHAARQDKSLTDMRKSIDVLEEENQKQSMEPAKLMTEKHDYIASTKLMHNAKMQEKKETIAAMKEKHKIEVKRVKLKAKEKLEEKLEEHKAEVKKVEEKAKEGEKVCI